MQQTNLRSQNSFSLDWKETFNLYQFGAPIRWTQVWVSSRSWWWTGKPGVLQSIGSQSVGYDWATELNWTWAGGALTAQLVKNLSAMQETWFDSWVRKIWPGEFHGLHSPWGHKESDITEQLSLHFNSGQGWGAIWWWYQRISNRHLSDLGQHVYYLLMAQTSISGHWEK